MRSRSTDPIRLHRAEDITTARPGDVVEVRSGADMEQEVIGYEHDIRPLFREKDVSEMSWAFDLASYDDVRTNADGILARLSNGSMPCDGAWPEGKVELFRNWVDAGCPA